MRDYYPVRPARMSVLRGAPLVTPTLALPDGRRVSGTPSIERLRELLARYLGAPLVPNKVWFLERNRQQIASFAGATREACSTQISHLQRAGVLRTDAAHHFVIPDVASLQIGLVDRLIHRAVG